MSTFTPLRPLRLLALLTCALGVLAAALVLVTLVLLALNGHPEGVLAAAAGALVPVALWGAWRLLRLMPTGIRSVMGSRLARDEVAAPGPRTQPKLDPTGSPTGTSQAPQSARLSRESAQTKPVKAAQAEDLSDAGELIRTFNAQSRQHEELWIRMLHAIDASRAAIQDMEKAEELAKQRRLGHAATQSMAPERRAPRTRQLAIFGLTGILDAVACNFAAQAFGAGQFGTLAWTTLFLAVLVSGEWGLNHFRDRNYRLWRAIALGLGSFVIGLGVLRYSFLINVSTGDLLAVVVGTALFTAATGLFVAAGYWALRRAETVATSRARRRARSAAKEAKAARERAARRLRERDRMVDAYLSRIRVSALQYRSPSRVTRIEAVVRALLLGEPTAMHSFLRQEQESRHGPAKD